MCLSLTHIDLVLLSCLEKMKNILCHSMFLFNVLARKNSYVLFSHLLIIFWLIVVELYRGRAPVQIRVSRKQRAERNKEKEMVESFNHNRRVKC